MHFFLIMHIVMHRCLRTLINTIKASFGNTIVLTLAIATRMCNARASRAEGGNHGSLCACVRKAGWRPASPKDRSGEGRNFDRQLATVRPDHALFSPIASQRAHACRREPLSEALDPPNVTFLHMLPSQVGVDGIQSNVASAGKPKITTNPC